MPPEEYPLVFVYGTLKRGFGNHRVLQLAGGELVCDGRTVERFPLVQNGLPYLLDHPGQGYNVEGEIFRVPDSDGWTMLDRLEGHPTFYERRLIDIEGSDGERYLAWAYFLALPSPDLLTLQPLRVFGSGSDRQRVGTRGKQGLRFE